MRYATTRFPLFCHRTSDTFERHVANRLRASREMSDTSAPNAKLVVTTHNQYQSEVTLRPGDVKSSPLDQFRDWFLEAQNNPSVAEPEAVSLSTATPSGVPSSRMVLLKQVDDRGFKIYTNYTSRKSQELKANPHASLNFYWRELHRQVRVAGLAEMVDREDSEDYFRSRPIGSQIGAWASRQSSVVGENEVLARFSQLVKRFDVEEGRGTVPMPEFWGGWRIVPEEVEFWAGKPSRLHDRIRYRRDQGDTSHWIIERLAP
ncbi:uncharacterized protein EI90DRAFT_3038656 [Cantharellus anzutake]|uniref:uncharacterized protein n=1 Tax=Cantharellus anzutake TaxID=1750568 RepID=UPI00190405B5|nr:uncharacterized protein EI90DRAFT_3091497 [Cantharellus anzutake]XP_038921558.1 uncharacterized protein EI90DRAFT_3038656 [Cantharellus anzutake]KAF8313757.1 hypothetical protein EI90DRAFT_3091497 [Cantharellus anzutake]KAF8339967.1 hypothetical protein EI90DRAFT_3038656 [Cantharellus anzutake]